MTPKVFLDTETTSLDEQTRVAWEFAAIRRNDNGTEVPLEFFIEVKDLTTADPGALRIGGFYDRHPMGRWLIGNTVDYRGPKTAKDAALAIATITHGAHVVGAQPDFDLITLSRLLFSQGILPSWHYRKYDVEAMTAGYLHREVGGLRACAEALDLTVDATLEHTAMGDTLTAMAIWDVVMSTGEVSG